MTAKDFVMIIESELWFMLLMTFPHLWLLYIAVFSMYMTALWYEHFIKWTLRNKRDPNKAYADMEPKKRGIQQATIEKARAMMNKLNKPNV